MTLKDRHPFPINQLNQMQRYLGEEMIEDYHTGELTRRQMLKRLVGICGSATAAAALLAAWRVSWLYCSVAALNRSS